MIEVSRLRYWWSSKQGFNGELDGSGAGEVLEKTGWARSVGGVNPYFTLFSRAGIGRDEAEKAVTKLQIHELPAARGCTYVVPASDFALALKIGKGFGEESEMQIAVKHLGVTEKEIEKLSKQITTALESGPKDPRALKEVVGDSVRNLGEAGKKRGITTTLPLALGRLQTAGHIRRIPVSGRLDQQRYAYALWSPSPMEKSNLTSGFTELARRYFQWIGPATLKEFQWFSGISLRDAKEAAAPLKLAPIEKENDLLILPDELDAFHSCRPAKQPRYSFVSSLDNLFHLRRDVSSFVDAKDLKRSVLVDKERKTLNGLVDLPNHAIVDRGRLVGLWEFEPSSGKIVSNCFIKPDKVLKAALEKTEEFVREQLGDARSFSLDSPQSRSARIAALRE